MAAWGIGMNDPEAILVATREDLQFLRDHHTHFLFPQRRRRVLLRLKALTEEENERWAKRIEESYFACGCTEGAAFLVLGTISYVFYLLAVRHRGIQRHDALTGIGLALFLSILGKCCGLLLARIRLKHAVKQILKRA